MNCYPNEVEYDLRDPYLLVQPKFNTHKFGFKSFRYYDATFWNMLPVHIKSCQSLHEFITAVTDWLSCNDNLSNIQIC